MEASVSSMDGSINSSPNARSTAAQSVDELKQMILCTKLELESTRAAAKAQAQVHKAKVAQLEDMLRSARKERDEALQKYMELQSSINVCSSSISSCSLFIAEDANTRNNAGSPLANSFNDQSSDWLNFGSARDHSSEDFSFSGFEDYGLEATTMEAAAINPAVLTAPTYFDNVTTGGGGYSTGSSSSWLQNGSALASILTPLQHQQVSEQNKNFISNMDNNHNSNNNNSSHSSSSVLDSPSADAEMNLMLRNLPERGKLLQAVMQAGPLLHTLLLAGPLPQWHHPPPVLDHLNSFQFPVPSIISNSFASSPSLDQHQHQQHTYQSCLSDGATKADSLCYNTHHGKRPRQLLSSYAKVC